MTFKIKRPLSPAERVMVKRLEKAEAIAAAYLSDSIVLQAQHRAMIQGTDWRRRLARWLIVWAERREGKRAKSGDSGLRPAPSE